MKKHPSRRQFIRQIGGAAAALTVGTSLAAENIHKLQTNDFITSDERVRIAVIGAGIIGHYDADAALKIPGVELTAVCDLYTGRLEYAREKWGNKIFTTRDYREVLARNDVDTVLVCTPDHWHDRMSIDAMNAGKHVYCEKPMVQKIEWGHDVIGVQKKTGKVFQVGSQRASSAGILKAKELYEQGIIGELTYVEAVNDRSNALGAWNYSIPTDASPETVDFDRFLGRAPKVPFNKTHFFRWRNYKAYGTGVAGDLFVHLLTGLHTITGAIGPTSIFALGDLNYWRDGRDVNDLVTSVMDYPKTAQHPSFQFFTRVNLADGSGNYSNYCRLIGTEGMIDIGWNELRVTHFKRPEAPGYGGYDAFTSFSARQKEDFKKWYEQEYAGKAAEWKKFDDIVFKPAEGYDDRYSHFVNFFESIRTGKPVLEDAVFGLRAAGPSLAANLSADTGKVVFWDPVRMKVVKRRT
ncbi:MAG: Inositol 2-dehydrogenase/D-chiro-inositol 3-dehydrogenase [Saprospiraceae bacterium]|nr:Inositol 2-dehydrogenase/D-chiro-inositol 3-dehydrogenase [Saprospiraceae bacterium]